MDKDLLKNVIADQREAVAAALARGDLIVREGVEACQAPLRRPNVLLISGMRRSGKSVFAHQVAKMRTYACVNFDDERLMGFRVEDFALLMSAFQEMYGDTDVLLLDEIQNIPGWELFVNRVRMEHRVIITGSNAHLLSSELATHLTGRYDARTLYPMSWREYMRYSALDEDPAAALSTRRRARVKTLAERYLRSGGIFEYHTLGRDHIRALFGAIIHKDIFGRYEVSFPHALEELALLMVNSFASRISVNKLAGRLNVKSPHTVKQYLTYLRATFLVFLVGKWSCKLHEQQSAAPKVYINDNGIIDSLSFEFTANRGRYLENAVAVELARRAHADEGDVYYWDDYRNECDFIVKKRAAIVSAIQVCHTLTDDNRRRELAGLTTAMDAFGLREGTIITDDQTAEEKVDGKLIRTLPFYVWAA